VHTDPVYVCMWYVITVQ